MMDDKIPFGFIENSSSAFVLRPERANTFCVPFFFRRLNGLRQCASMLYRIHLVTRSSMDHVAIKLNVHSPVCVAPANTCSWWTCASWLKSHVPPMYCNVYLAMLALPTSLNPQRPFYDKDAYMYHRCRVYLERQIAAVFDVASGSRLQKIEIRSPTPLAWRKDFQTHFTWFSISA